MRVGPTIPLVVLRVVHRTPDSAICTRLFILFPIILYRSKVYHIRPGVKAVTKPVIERQRTKALHYVKFFYFGAGVYDDQIVLVEAQDGIDFHTITPSACHTA